MKVKKFFQKDKFYKYRFMDESKIFVLKIPYDDFKVTVVPSVIEVEDNDLIFSTIMCIKNSSFLSFLEYEISNYDIFEMITPYPEGKMLSDKEEFLMFNCNDNDVVFISDDEKPKLSNFNMKKYGTIFLVTEDKNIFLKAKLFL